MSHYSIRNARIQDIGFLVKTIIEAEMSGSDKLSYSTVFGLSLEETEICLSRMLHEEIDGCELSTSSYLIAEKDGVVIAAVGAWIEGENGVSSTILKGSLLATTLSPDNILRSSKCSKLISQVHIEPIKGSIQIGVVYVAPEHRGKQLVELLIRGQIAMLKQRSNVKHEAYVQVFGNNIAAIRSYERLGFVINSTVVSSDLAICQYLPDNVKILMKLEI